MLWRPLERLDRLHHGTGPGETGRLVAKLQSYGPLQGFVVSLLQMIIQRIWPLANNHPTTCKWSSVGSSLFQRIIQRIPPLANDHPEDSTSCKWSSRGSGLLQMIIQMIRPLADDHPEDLAFYKWSLSPPSPYNHLSQDLNSISRTFLEQFALVYS